jgi:hypothetical protein
MPEIGTSGSTSGDGKRGVGYPALSHRARPRLYSRPPEPPFFVIPLLLE